MIYLSNIWFPPRFQMYANVKKTHLSNVSKENILQLKKIPNKRQPQMEVLYKTCNTAMQIIAV